jgi:hypothetical protein
MTDEQQQDRPDQWLAERAIVLQVLGDEHPERWARVELEIAVDDIDPLTVSDALALLAADGVVTIDGESVEASPCTRRMDHLDLVAI